MNTSPIITGATADSVSIATKLDEARALIEKGWTQGEYARDADGESTEVSCDPAVCFCAYGAISMAARGSPQADYLGADLDIYDRYLFVAVGVKNGQELISWNDAPERTQAEVIEAFKRAADLARADAS